MGKTAAIVVIGDEILSGHTQDTNSYFLAGQLNTLGIPVTSIMAVPDNVQAIRRSLSLAEKQADFIFTTGGLGPTKDDKTKIALQEFFCQPLRLDESTYEHLAKFFKEKGRDTSHLELNRSQAEVLRDAEVIQNNYGTAPCMQLQKDGKFFWILPGVPYEVKPLFRDKIIPYLQELASTHFIENRIITVVGIPESVLSQTLEKWEGALPKNVELGYLPTGNRIRLKLTAKGKNSEELQTQLQELAASLKPLIEDSVLSWQGQNIVEVFLDMMRSRDLTVAMAESFTGGHLIEMLVEQPNISQIVKGSMVAYHTEVKEKILGIPHSLIEKHNVASPEVAEAMARAAVEKFESDLGFGTTGVSGPMGDGSGVPVGTVFYSIYFRDKYFTKELYLPHLDRGDVMQFAAQRVLQDAMSWLQEMAP